MVTGRAKDCLEVQRGVISWGQALGSGMTPGDIRWQVDSGRWLRVADGHYFDPQFASEDAWTAEVLSHVAHLRGAAAFQCAAALWGADRQIPYSGIQVITPHDYRGTERVTVYRATKAFYDVELMANGIHVTSLPWTLAMLGTFAPLEEVEWALDWAIRRGHTTEAELQHLLRTQAPHRRAGFKTLRKVFALRGTPFIPTGSFLETCYLQLLRWAHLPMPVLQFPIPGTKLSADFAYPGQKVVVETLGKGPHGPLFDYDRARVDTIKVKLPGWTVLEFTRNHVLHQRMWVAATTAHFLKLAPRFDR